MSDKIVTCNDLDLLHPSLRAQWEGGVLQCTWRVRVIFGSQTPYEDSARIGLHIFETHRPTAEQRKRYEMRNEDGQRVTRCDGVISWSRHQDNPSTAMDIVVTLDGRMTWDMRNPLVAAGYHALRDAAEALGFQSGGRWKMGYWPHVQMQGEDRVAEAQRLLNALGYDCGEVDGIHGRKTDNALDWFCGTKVRDRGASHIRGRLGPAEWTALWRVARERGVA